jgi:hypothetical protein
MNAPRLPISVVFTSLLLVLLLATSPTRAITPISSDPQGFEGIKWDTALHTLRNLSLIDSDDRIQTYQFSKNTLRFANTHVESLRLLTIDGKFARVMIRYQGEDSHQAIMMYLTRQYGPVTRRPGSMMRGLNQENTWRGDETEATLNYREHGERGFLMIQSRILAPRFLDMTSDHGH